MTTDALLDLSVGQRTEAIAWDVCDQYGRTIGSLNGAGGQLDVNGSATRVRTCVGVTFDPTEFADINVFTDWLRPLFVLSDGRRFPLGLLTFVADPATWRSGQASHQPTLHDGCALIDIPILYSIGGGSGTSVRDVALRTIEAAGVPLSAVEDTSAVFLDPVLSPGASATYRQVLVRCCALAGWLPPHFDHNGYLRLRAAPDIEREPDVSYTGARIINGTRVVDPHLLESFNAHRVTSSGATAAPITALAFVNPAAPNSKENREGRVSVKEHTIQGIESQAVAETMAARFAAADPATFETISFTGPLDPRHDVFSVVRVNGTAYLEQNHNMQLQAGGRHTHTVQRSSAVDLGV